MSSQIAVKENKQTTIGDLLQSQSVKNQIALALPKHVTVDRFIRVALTSINKNPKLRQATQSSLCSCIITAAGLGLEIDNRRAHLVPYENKKKGVIEAQLMTDYKGIVELVMRNGDVASIHADIVRRGDEFDYNFGTGSFLRHKPNLGEQGDAYAVYSYARNKDGSESFEVMSLGDVEAIRKRSRSSDSGPWVTDYNEMCKKTVFRRHSKWLKLSPEIRQVIEHDDELQMDDDTKIANAKPIKEVPNFGNPIEEDLDNDQESKPVNMSACEEREAKIKELLDQYDEINYLAFENKAKKDGLIGVSSTLASLTANEFAALTQNIDKIVKEIK